MDERRRGRGRSVSEGGVRPYAVDDRAAVRRICHDTGYMGDPAAWFWRDAESFADLWSSYYTDREPESAFVVEQGGRVTGYLLGCRDTAATGGWARPIRRHLFGRGLLVRPGTAGTLWRVGADLVGDKVQGRPATVGEVHDPRWPAHLHIDLLPEARGQGFGRELVDAWLGRLRGDGVAGCHLGTWAENATAIAFFEAMGFRRQGEPVPMPGIRSPSGERHHSLLMVQDLAPGSHR